MAKGVRGSKSSTHSMMILLDGHMSVGDDISTNEAIKKQRFVLIPRYVLRKGATKPSSRRPFF